MSVALHAVGLDFRLGQRIHVVNKRREPRRQRRRSKLRASYRIGSMSLWHRPVSSLEASCCRKLGYKRAGYLQAHLPEVTSSKPQHVKVDKFNQYVVRS
jgi:hypothetical protein